MTKEPAMRERDDGEELRRLTAQVTALRELVAEGWTAWASFLSAAGFIVTCDERDRMNAWAKKARAALSTAGTGRASGAHDAPSDARASDNTEA